MEELQGRNYAYRTAKTYVRSVREFAEHFHQPPDKPGPEQIRQCQAYLFQTKKPSPATVSQYVLALRFLFVLEIIRHGCEMAANGVEGEKECAVGHEH